MSSFTANPNRALIRDAVIAVTVTNILIFASLAITGNISGDPKTIVFIDFWGRFVVYSLWFAGYSLYRKYLDPYPAIQGLITTIVAMNIPAFLLLSYFEKFSVTPTNLAIIDFWGRLTVYSLWFILYELYRKYLSVD